MSDMFCFQCQQTAGNKGCVRTGVCGKQPATAQLQDQLITQLIRLAEAAERCGEHTPEASRLLIDGLFTTLTNVNFDDDAIRRFTDRVTAEEAPARAEIYRGQLQAYSDALSRIMEMPVERRVLYFFQCGQEISL
jgi:hydroxylamine reductase (hybrid-cluster protein)